MPITASCAMFILAPKFDSMNDKTFRNRISKPGDTGRMGKALSSHRSHETAVSAFHSPGRETGRDMVPIDMVAFIIKDQIPINNEAHFRS